MKLLIIGLLLTALTGQASDKPNYKDCGTVTSRSDRHQEDFFIFDHVNEEGIVIGRLLRVEEPGYVIAKMALNNPELYELCHEYSKDTNKWHFSIITK